MNTRELEALAGVSHASNAAGYVAVAAGLGVVIAGHTLGRLWNRARGNRFETRFHTAGLVIAGTTLAWSLFAIGVDTLAAVAHARDAKGMP